MLLCSSSERILQNCSANKENENDPVLEKNLPVKRVSKDWD